LNPVAIIQKKRDGQRLSREEISAFLGGYVRGSVPDYQMAALAMAIFLQGMDAEETAALTEVMLHSGARLGRRWRVDKHSTGGIGDKVSLVLAPLLACCDLRVPMLSGRGLGPSGGTLDKLEAIPGFRTDLTAGEIEQIVDRVGCVITGQTADLVPADKKLYALRDVTATVPSIPLITASIMSKKLAEDLDALVLDVKWGSGAFMKTFQQAQALAQSLRDVGTHMGLKTMALITDMNQPLGRMAGNAVEVMEAIDTLCGRGPDDLVELTLALGAELLLLVGRASSLAEGREELVGALDSGRGLEKFREMVRAQGGDPDAALAIAPATPLGALRDGFVAAIDGEKIGYAIIALGGGRQQLCDKIGASVGIEMLVRLGDRVSAGQPWVNLLAHERGREEATQLLNEAIHIADEPPPPLPLIAERLASL
jgi:pyrimidine-nucleoside phosphorylase